MGSDRVLTLSVGGTLFSTTVGTLKKEPNSLLTEQFTCNAGLARAVVDDEGRFFIDRDPKHFTAVLNHLRDGGSSELPSSPQDRQELLAEARYFRIDSLVRRLEEAAGPAAPAGPRLAIGIPHAVDTYRSVIDRARLEAGAENIARAEGALFAMLFSPLLAGPASPFHAKDGGERYDRSSSSSSGEREQPPFELLGRRALSLYYHTSNRERNAALDRAADLGAPCAGREFAAFVKRYFSVLQYDFLQQGYVLQADQRWERLILEIPLGLANSDGSSGVLFEHLIQSLAECCAASEDRTGAGGRALSVRKPPSKH